MPLELAVAAGALILVIILLAKARPAEPKDDLEHARCFIDGRIEEHIARLSAAYLRCGGGEGSDAFTREVEGFIGDILMRACSRGPHDAELRDDVRELLVLERAWVYQRILARVREHLALETD